MEFRHLGTFFIYTFERVKIYSVGISWKLILLQEVIEERIHFLYLVIACFVPAHVTMLVTVVRNAVYFRKLPLY